ncbi:MAG: DarT ssDNA thymidine ADP-ribosyltransferase family protein [Candidatus Azotimanducaceae bacterium WSBS_2022_MAG_OTU7]
MNVDQLIELIKKSPRHRYLYHFTDEANFPSISQKGLVSKARMRDEKWWPNATGGNQLSHDLDTRQGIDPYVSLCFTQKHGMEYWAHKDGRLPNPRYLGIHPEVLKIEGARISFDVANATNAQLLPVSEAIDQLDQLYIDVIYSQTDWSDPAVQQRLKTAEKFEVLIPDNVPRDLIAGFF